MASPANLRNGLHIEDLTKANFGEEENVLKFRFVRTGTSERNVEDGIRFSPPWPELVTRIIELTRGIQLYKVPYFYPGDKTDSCQVSVKDCGKFFQAIWILQTAGSEICILTNVFRSVLHELQESRYMTTAEAQHWQLNIRTGSTLKEYENETEQAKDVQRALSLAYYYLHLSKKRQALDWLCDAKRYLKDQPLSALISLSEFLKWFPIIDSVKIFEPHAEEIALKVASCPSVKELYFGPLTDYSLDTAEGIGKLLERTTSIERVFLGSFLAAKNRKLGATTVIPIANALRVNRSVQMLNLSYTHIGDEGVVELMQAIKSNPRSKIEELNLFCCGMTDTGAGKLIKFLRYIKQIKRVNTLGNDKIDQTLQDEIREILYSR